MPKKLPPFSVYTDIKAKIAQVDETSDPITALGLYKQLVALYPEPTKKFKDMSATEKLQFRADRKARRAAGINLRTGQPWTPEQRAKQEARWTPEAKAAASARAKERAANTPDEVKVARAEKLQQAAQARAAKQLAMEQRLAELEAELAKRNGTSDETPEPESNQVGRRNRK